MNLTNKERMLLASGKGMWHTNDLNGKLEGIHLSDGPYGLRKQEESAKSNNDSILATCFPTPSAVASSWDIENARLMANAIGSEAYNENVAILLGPGVNMKRSPLCGRNFEYFSEDPFLAGSLGSSYVKAVEALGVGTSLKHFAANQQETKRMTSNSMVDERALREIYLKAFEMVVKEAKPATLMAAYNKLNGSYCTENDWLLNQVLRKEWGYQGAVMSDWGACLRLTKALKSGMDLEMPDSHGFHLKMLKKDFKKGLITEEELATATNRTLHLIDTYSPSKRKDKKDVSKNHELAVDIASDSAVLLENDGILPLATKTITIVGGLAKTVRYQGGGSSHIHTESVLNAIEAFTKAGYSVTYYEGYSADHASIDEEIEKKCVSSIGSEETILFFGGLPEFAEGEGYDRATLAMPENQISLFDKLYEKNKNIIFISFGGAPYVISFKDKCRAILHMYLGGEGVMEACERLVSGAVNPSGKLAETFPLSIEDTPAYGNFATGSKDIAYKESIFIGYRYYDTFGAPVLYPFGYGKSYTSFEYSNLRVEEQNQRLMVSFTITNTGSVFGKEIAQVYVGRDSKDYLHPKKELKAFTKVSLKPKESKEVCLSIPLDSLAIYDIDLGWVIPKGNAVIYVGKSVDEIVLENSITVDGVEYKKDVPSVYLNIDNKLKNISDEDFKAIYKSELSHFDDCKKGTFTIENSLVELAPYSFKARKLLQIAKKVLYKQFKGKPKDDPEVMMMIETLSTGSMDCICCQGGIPYRLGESIVLSANGHRFKALHKLIWG